MRTRDDTRDETRDETRDGTGNGTSADAGPGVLTDPAWVVPPVPQDVPAGSMAGLVGEVARAHHAHGETVPAADAALARLVAACGGAWDEDTAALEVMCA